MCLRHTSLKPYAPATLLKSLQVQSYHSRLKHHFLEDFVINILKVFVKTYCLVYFKSDIRIGAYFSPTLSENEIWKIGQRITTCFGARCCLHSQHWISLTALMLAKMRDCYFSLRTIGCTNAELGLLQGWVTLIKRHLLPNFSLSASSIWQYQMAFQGFRVLSLIKTECRVRVSWVCWGSYLPVTGGHFETTILPVNQMWQSDGPKSLLYYLFLLILQCMTQVWLFYS